MKALVVSYHFPPLNHIASYRTKAIADYFHENDISATIVTHDWLDGWSIADEGIKLENNGDYSVIRLPLDRSLQSHKDSNRFETIGRWLRGEFDNAGMLEASAEIFKRFLWEHLKDANYDLVIGLYSPYFPIRLCYQIHKNFDIPYVIDFRDLPDDRVLSSHQIDFPNKLRLRLLHPYLKKWLRHSLFTVSISEEFATYIAEKWQTNSYEITNGFEDEYLHQEGEDKGTNTFDVSSIGTLYEFQDLQIFLAGFTKFYKSVDQPELIRLNFIGVRPSYRKGVLEEIRSGVPEEVALTIEERVPKQEVAKFYGTSQVLLFPVPLGFRGFYTGKLFEYLGNRRNILVFPDDDQVAAQLVKRTKAGEAFSTSEEISRYLIDKFTEWKREGSCNFDGDKKEIAQYSRRTIMKKFTDLIKHHL